MLKKPIAVGTIALIVIALGVWGLVRSSSPHPPQASGVTPQPAEKMVDQYVCPMHPAVRSEKPGECPVCGMDLVKQTVRPKVSDHERQEGEGYFTCPMHESVRTDHPGSCPVCGMTLVKKTVQKEMQEANASNLAAVSLSPTQRVMANITTTKVHRRSVYNDIQAVGIVSYAEPNYRILSMRFAGRIEKLYLTFTGQTVHKGDPVADVYSPDATSELQTYLRTLDMYNQTTRTGGEVTDAVSVALKRQTQRLLQLGFTEGQIAELSESDTLSTYVTILSPVSGTVVKKNIDPGGFAEAGASLFDVADLSTVWILLDVYEKEIPLVRTGCSVQITTEVYPLEKFKGRVVFLDPVLNPETRTIRVRTEFPNPSGKLKPNMYVNGTIAVPQSNVLVVPSTAIVPAGRRSVVWVELEENTFVPRNVVAGATSDGFTAILSGLREGDVVAATGGFLIDSESALSESGNDEANQ